MAEWLQMAASLVSVLMLCGGIFNFSVIKPLNESVRSLRDCIAELRRQLSDTEAKRQKMAERLYRLWFSHPALNGIVYWNLVDNTAQLPENPDEPVYNENKAFGGLLNNDAELSEKPVFSVLKHLIRDEWNTSGILEYDTEKGMEYFRGFYGPYHLEIQTDSGCFPAEILLSSSWKNEFEITLPE